MGNADYYADGEWNASCFECGRKFKSSEMRKTWQNYYACPRCWRPRQPQDFVRGIPERINPPWAQSLGADIFIGLCTANGSSAVPGDIEPNCVSPGYLSPAYIVDT